MKSRVRLSKFSITLTTIITGIFIAACIATFDERPAFLCILGLLIVILLFSAIYAPIYVSANTHFIKVSSLLSGTIIQLSEIEHVELFQPTMGAVRILASGGYFGYWGTFRENDIGRYKASYGRASDCFILIMKNGDKYVFGCKNPQSMVDYIKNNITVR